MGYTFSCLFAYFASQQCNENIDLYLMIDKKKTVVIKSNLFFQLTLIILFLGQIPLYASIPYPTTV